MKTQKHKTKINEFADNDNKFDCKYCLKPFSSKQSLDRHIKYTCKKSKDEDFKELARLLNVQLQEQQKMASTQSMRIENLEKQIEKLTSKLQIQGLNEKRTQRAENMKNINMFDFKDTDYSHLTEEDYLRCINNKSYCVKALIEKIHFDVNKPENMNIYISSIKGNYVMIYQDNQWQIDMQEYAINELYDKNEFHLETWYEKNKDKYPQMIKSFEIYLKKKSDSDIINDIKQEIIMMLYNKRNLIPMDAE
jgi:hypothetical protein